MVRGIGVLSVKSMVDQVSASLTALGFGGNSKSSLRMSLCMSLLRSLHYQNIHPQGARNTIERLRDIGN